MVRNFEKVDPQPMHYGAETIVCLADDLKRYALERLMKRKLAGDTKAAGKFSTIIQPGSPIAIGDTFKGPDARLTIVGHGSDDGQWLISNDQWGIIWNAETLATKVKAWMGGDRIGRISLHVCNAAGNRGGRALNDKAWLKDFVGSLAYKLASYCGFANSISGKTARQRGAYVGDERTPLTGRVHSFVADSREDPDREMVKGDKYIFFPDPAATLEKPVKPKVEFATFKDL